MHQPEYFLKFFLMNPTPGIVAAVAEESTVEVDSRRVRGDGGGCVENLREGACASFVQYNHYKHLCITELERNRIIIILFLNLII